MTTTFTNHFRFGIPDFLSGPWHATFQELIRHVDAVLYEITISEGTTVWTNTHAYIVGNTVIDPTDGHMFVCLVDHTSAASPTSFATDRSNNPTYWASFGVGPDLDAIEALTTTGLLTRTGDATWVTRTVTGPAAGLSVSNGDGVSGNPTLALANDLAAIEGLSTTGILVRTTTDTWALRTITAPSAGFTISNPVSGNIAFTLADDLAALEALSSSGFPERTGSNTWSISGFTGTGSVVRANAPTFTGSTTVSINTATTQADYFTLLPTDFGTGKPKFVLKKEATATKYTILLYDGVDTSGNIDFDVGSLTYRTSQILYSGSALGTPASGALNNCTGYTESIIIACSDETTALTTGTSKVTFKMPYAFNIVSVRASLSTVQSSGSIFTVDINEGGSSILGTKLTIDNGEKSSTTAATQATITDSSIADDGEITIDIDQIGDGTAKGLKVYLIGRR